ncbi:hypothetical protein BpHYR1_000316 [Brachionus plicatilis]|uniref:Uncharacterized protein n=1 Tax=Brachionus plicatilis TaxID=10195 RepID=A0A3M7SI19_BRAPC|nr:hypothetical protein BpHYR1_000316 [Brachionus plicatilis]
MLNEFKNLILFKHYGSRDLNKLQLLILLIRLFELSQRYVGAGLIYSVTLVDRPVKEYGEVVYLFNFLCFYSIARLIRRTLIHSELPGFANFYINTRVTKIEYSILKTCHSILMIRSTQNCVGSKNLLSQYHSVFVCQEVSRDQYIIKRLVQIQGKKSDKNVLIMNKISKLNTE